MTQFSVYRSFTSLVKFIHRYFIIFDKTVKGMVLFLIICQCIEMQLIFVYYWFYWINLSPYWILLLLSSNSFLCETEKPYLKVRGNRLWNLKWQNKSPVYEKKQKLLFQCGEACPHMCLNGCKNKKSSSSGCQGKQGVLQTEWKDMQIQLTTGWGLMGIMGWDLLKLQRANPHNRLKIHLNATAPQ